MSLTIEQIAQFKDSGYLVVEDVFDPDEVSALRDSLHTDLAQSGYNHDDMLAGIAEPPAGVRKAGPTNDFIYRAWKLNAQRRVYDISLDLLRATHLSGDLPGYTHPFGHVDGVVPYIDRMCYRLPDHIRAEGGLELHMDRNVRHPFGTAERPLKFFRPIQSLIALTSHYGGASGGTLLVPKFHLEYDSYFAGRETDSENDASGKITGQFFRMGSKSYCALAKRLVPISVPAGAVLFWDNRLPHATCATLVSDDTREVVYFSYLPAVGPNVALYRESFYEIEQALAGPANSELLEWYRRFLE